MNSKKLCPLFQRVPTLYLSGIKVRPYISTVQFHSQHLSNTTCTSIVKNSCNFPNSISTFIHVKNMSGSSSKPFTVSYNDIVQEQKDGNTLIIDVREQSEINETGKLPGSVHIPMGDVVNVLTNLSEEAFKEKYEKSKPTTDSKIIVSCRSGKRSGMVQEEMQKLGYTNVYNYSGGWLDWENKTKQ